MINCTYFYPRIKSIERFQKPDIYFTYRRVTGCPSQYVAFAFLLKLARSTIPPGAYIKMSPLNCSSTVIVQGKLNL